MDNPYKTDLSDYVPIFVVFLAFIATLCLFKACENELYTKRYQSCIENHSPTECANAEKGN